MATVFHRVRKIVVDQLGSNEDDVKLDSSFVDDLEADSLDMVELIMSIEEEFSTDGITDIPDEEAETIRTVEDAVNWLKAHGVFDS